MEYTNTILDALRLEGDPLADKVVATLAATGQIEAVNGAQAVIRKLIRVVAQLAGFAGRAHFSGAQGELIGGKQGGEDMPQVAGFAGHPRGDEALADMAVNAGDPRVRRDQVRAVLRWHGMAGCAAERG